MANPLTVEQRIHIAAGFDTEKIKMDYLNLKNKTMNTNTQPKVFKWTDELVKEFILSLADCDVDIPQEFFDKIKAVAIKKLAKSKINQ